MGDWGGDGGGLSCRGELWLSEGGGLGGGMA